VAIRLPGVLREDQRQVVKKMFPTSPSLFAVMILLVLAAVLTLGFAVIWLVFAATLIVSMLVAIHRSIPRAER
jgi:hypothetical protein